MYNWAATVLDKPESAPYSEKILGDLPLEESTLFQYRKFLEQWKKLEGQEDRLRKAI